MNAPVRITEPQPPPHSIEAEQALLGAVLINNDALGMASGIVDPAHFYEPVHREIYRLIVATVAAGGRATPITLQASLPNIDIAGLPLHTFLARLCGEATTIINAPDYARHIRDLAVVRGVIAVGRRLQDMGSSGEPPSEAVAAAFAELDELRVGERSSAGDTGSAADMVRRFVADAEAARAGGRDDAVMSTGLTDLDRALKGGYRSGRLIVLAGRPGMGKTALALSSTRRAVRVAQRADPRCEAAFYSLEIDRDEIVARMTADEMFHARVPLAYGDIIANHLCDADWQRVRRFGDAIAELPIHIDARGGIGMAEIAARSRILAARCAQRGTRLGLVAIDYLGLIRKTDRYHGKRVHELGEIALSAKQLAKELKTCVLLLQQLSRGVEGRDNKRPTMADLRDSGEIEEHADVVALLYRPAYYDQRDPRQSDGDLDFQTKADTRRNDLDVILDKNRLGPAITVSLFCSVPSSSVDNKSHY